MTEHPRTVLTVGDLRDALASFADDIKLRVTYDAACASGDLHVHYEQGGVLGLSLDGDYFP